MQLRFDRKSVLSAVYWLILCGALAAAAVIVTRGQAAQPFATVAATVPPAVGQPGVTLAWDTTNKLLVVTFSLANAAGAISTLTTISYNPRTLEGTGTAGAVFSVAGVTVSLKHNVAADPLTWQIGTATAMLAQCSTATPLPAGAVACAAIPF